MKKNLAVFVASTFLYLVSYSQPGGGAGTGAEHGKVTDVQILTIVKRF
jgi:hypothetical protein